MLSDSIMSSSHSTDAMHAPRSQHETDGIINLLPKYKEGPGLTGLHPCGHEGGQVESARKAWAQVSVHCLMSRSSSQGTIDISIMWIVRPLQAHLGVASSVRASLMMRCTTLAGMVDSGNLHSTAEGLHMRSQDCQCMSCT